MFSNDIRVCSSTIHAIFTVLPSMVESNWKSYAHTTFGASASTIGTEDLPGPFAARRPPRICALNCAVPRQHPRHGFRRAWAWLRYDKGIEVNKKKVHRLWKEEGLQGTPSWRRTRCRRPQREILSPTAKRAADHPAHRYHADVGAIRAQSGWAIPIRPPTAALGADARTTRMPGKQPFEPAVLLP
ncbi:transposase (plasmid) [Rhodococcus sp. ZPP]|nr:transposase [Rhodococcus sp. ZPP]